MNLDVSLDHGTGLDEMVNCVLPWKQCTNELEVVSNVFGQMEKQIRVEIRLNERILFCCSYCLELCF